MSPPHPTHTTRDNLLTHVYYSIRVPVWCPSVPLTRTQQQQRQGSSCLCLRTTRIVVPQLANDPSRPVMNLRGHLPCGWCPGQLMVLLHVCFLCHPVTRGACIPYRAVHACMVCAMHHNTRHTNPTAPNHQTETVRTATAAQLAADPATHAHIHTHFIL